MRKWTLLVAFGCAFGLGACADSGGGGLSVEAACNTFCDTFVDCTVENEVDVDNVTEACMTTCSDAIDVVESDNPDNEDCEQAYREYWRCLGRDATCDEIESQMFDEETCRSEAFDYAEFCET